jgi:hypothetical protein
MTKAALAEQISAALKQLAENDNKLSVELKDNIDTLRDDLVLSNKNLLNKLSKILVSIVNPSTE